MNAKHLTSEQRCAYCDEGRERDKDGWHTSKYAAHSWVRCKVWTPPLPAALTSKEQTLFALLKRAQRFIYSGPPRNSDHDSESVLSTDIRAALESSADETPADQKHYPEEWGPRDARQLTCVCGNPDPGHMSPCAVETAACPECAAVRKLGLRSCHKHPSPVEMTAHPILRHLQGCAVRQAECDCGVDARWICSKCATANGLDKTSCLGCGRQRPRRAHDDCPF